MPGGSRALPARPNLRYLKTEAKRRLAAGQFATLHDAQTAIAREHGQPSWAALKQLIEGETHSYALAQLRWVISRFSGADQPGWAPPGEDELREHFSDSFLAALPPADLVTAISQLAAELRGDLAIIGQAPFEALVELAGVQYIATVETEPPHRLTSLRGVPMGRRLRDPRTAGDTPQRTRGNVPDGVPAIAAKAVADLGLPALLLAGGDPDTKENWVLTRGWADLDRHEPLDPGHRFPAPGVTALVTTTAVLRLVADAQIGLDHRANEHLTTTRLADDTITVRELLSHRAGVDDPTEMYAPAVPENLAALMGPVIGCHGPRGVIRPSNGGIAVLGQLIADVTATPFAEAATNMVLGPLGLRDSSFPARHADVGPGAVTSYNLTLQGMFEPLPALVSTLQAVAGLWSTGTDLVRLGLGWSSLLPRSLAHEALTTQVTPQLTPQLTSQAEPTASGQGPGVGLGWLIGPGGDIAAHAGAGPEASADLTIRIRDNRTHVILTSRFIPINTIDVALLHAWTDPT